MSKGGRPRKLTIPLTLTPTQKIVHASEAQHRIVKAGRRWGKSHYAAYWLLKRALENPGRHWVVAKTNSLAVDEHWTRWMSWLPPEVIVRQDQTRHRLSLKIGEMRSELGCASAEKQDNLRGRGLSSMVLDEAAFVTPTLYNEILAPMLLDHDGPSLIISSAKPGWFESTWQKASRNQIPNWAAFKFTVYDNARSKGGIIKDHKIEEMKASTPPHIWESEYMAEVGDGSGVVYSTFDDRNIYNPEQRFQDVKEWPIIIPIDWGKRDFTGISWMSISPEGYVVISEEHSQNGWDVPQHVEMMRRISRDFEQLTDNDYVLSHDAFRTKPKERDSIADDFARNGIRCKPSTRDLMATINKMRVFINGRDDVPWLYVSSKCTTTIQAMQSWMWSQHEIDILQSIRYGLEEICRRKMTPYAKLIPKYDGKSTMGEFISREAPGEIRLTKPTLRKGGTWGWDSQHGVPI